MTYRCPAVPDPAGIPWATRPVTLKQEILGKDAHHMTKFEMMKAVLANTHRNVTAVEEFISNNTGTAEELSAAMQAQAIEVLDVIHSNIKDALDLTHGMAREIGVQL